MYYLSIVYAILYRQWVFKEFAMKSNQAEKAISEWYQPELEVVDNFILLDVRNNSAWNQVQYTS